MLADLDTLPPAVKPNAEMVERLVRQRQPDYVSFAAWQRIDQLEISRGRAEGRPRLKFSRIEDMVAAANDSRPDAADPAV
jgi:ferredoxin/flavodoxin---NADP+ reductase